MEKTVQTMSWSQGVLGLAALACLVYLVIHSRPPPQGVSLEKNELERLQKKLDRLFFLASKLKERSKEVSPVASVRDKEDSSPMVSLQRGKTLCLGNTHEWEHDYVRHLLGPDAEVRQYAHPSVHHEPSVSAADKKDPLSDGYTDWEVLVWSTHIFSVDEALRYAQSSTRRRALVVLGDEWTSHLYNAQSTTRELDPKKKSFARVFNLFPLVLRQHTYVVQERFYSPQTRLFFMPLGYARHLFSFAPIRRRLLRVDERPFVWSFSGDDRKADRAEMIAQMTQLSPRPHQAQSSSSDVMMRMRSQIRDLYEKSIFVPIGRGNDNNDCFRVYESAACGAIPVIVLSDEKHRNFTFGRVGKFDDESITTLPPWLFYSSWTQARMELEKLLTQPQHLIMRQQMTLSWWEHTFERTSRLLNP